MMPELCTAKACPSSWIRIETATTTSHSSRYAPGLVPMPISSVISRKSTPMATGKPKRRKRKLGSEDDTADPTAGKECGALRLAELQGAPRHARVRDPLAERTDLGQTVAQIRVERFSSGNGRFDRGQAEDAHGGGGEADLDGIANRAGLGRRRVHDQPHFTVGVHVEDRRLPRDRLLADLGNDLGLVTELAQLPGGADRDHHALPR